MGRVKMQQRRRPRVVDLAHDGVDAKRILGPHPNHARDAEPGPALGFEPCHGLHEMKVVGAAAKKHLLHSVGSDCLKDELVPLVAIGV